MDVCRIAFRQYAFYSSHMLQKQPTPDDAIGGNLFSKTGFCYACYEKQIKIDKLTEEVESLKTRLSALERKAKWAINPHAPSSKEIFVKSSKASKKRPGHKKGQPGFKRSPVDHDEPHRFQKVAMPDSCPDCGHKLLLRTYDERKVIDLIERQVETVVYEIAKGHCSQCNKCHRANHPVLPKALIGNQLLAEAAVMAYVDHIPVSKITGIYGDAVQAGTLFKSFYRVADLLKPAMEVLKQDFRSNLYRHADETGWRTDGKSGYAWVFCTGDTSIFQFEDTRAGSVARGILGIDPLPGFLTVDRYGGYNKVSCELQYCYAHLLRDVKALEKSEPLNETVKVFVSQLSHSLSEAMRLQRDTELDDVKYYEAAKILQKDIETVVLNRSEHLGILKIQTIFRDKASRLYHWVSDRNVCSHNNFGERTLRGTVVARKVSYGSKSAKGRESRSILMSVLYTAKQRLNGDRNALVKWFKEALDAFSSHSKPALTDLLPPIPSS